MIKLINLNFLIYKDLIWIFFFELIFTTLMKLIDMYFLFYMIFIIFNLKLVTKTLKSIS